MNVENLARFAAAAVTVTELPPGARFSIRLPGDPQSEQPTVSPGNRLRNG